MEDLDLDSSKTQEETQFNTYLKQLELIHRELGSKGGPGENPGWLKDYASRLHEVAAGLENLAADR